MQSDLLLEEQLLKLVLHREYSLTAIVDRLNELGHDVGGGVMGCATLVAILRKDDRYIVRIPDPQKLVDWSHTWTIKRVK